MRPMRAARLFAASASAASSELAPYQSSSSTSTFTTVTTEMANFFEATEKAKLAKNGTVTPAGRNRHASRLTRRERGRRQRIGCRGRAARVQGCAGTGLLGYRAAGSAA